MSEPSLWETVAKAGIGHGLKKEAELQARITDLEEALRPFAKPSAGPDACTTHQAHKLGMCKDLGVEPVCDTCRARALLEKP